MKGTYVLLRNADGRFMGKGFRFADRVNDDYIWQWKDGELVLVADPGVSVGVLANPGGTRASVRGIDESLEIRPGPTRMPDEHLDELDTTGLTIVENILSPEAATRLRTAALDRLPDDAEQYDARVGVPHGVSWSRDVAECVTHPLALWLIETYLGNDAIHFCHQPIVTVMRPANELIGTFPDSGWHSDYPYHPGVMDEGRWGDDAPLAVQFNVCVDAFRENNGATQYLPRSHEYRRFPPDEFNEGGTRMGEGVHRQVRQMLAPAGAALIYDARVWHRACEELNVSGEDRVAILNAVALSWVRPMSDKSPGTAVYRSSDMSECLTTREREDIERLCHAPTATSPPDAPEIRER